MPWILGIAVLLAGALIASGQDAHAQFSQQRTNTSSFAAATSFPDYPTAVLADHPLFYYRGDDVPGSPVAADSSGNGNTGVYGSGGAVFMAPFNEGSGAVAHDDSGATTPNNVALTNTTWAAGRAGMSGVFNGVSSVGTTTAAATPTNASFTVSAWVYLTDNSVTRTVLSQDGTSASGFSLQYLKSSNKWAFAMPQTDSASPATDVVLSTSTPALNTWTSLIATFNGSTMSLAVNGVTQSTGAHTASWNATGSLVVGADKSGGARGDYWAGQIQDVRVYNSVVSPSSLVYGSYDSGPASSWSFSENSGTTTADGASGLEAGTLGSGASWTTGVSGSGVALSGSATSYVQGAIPAVNTANSFSVSAWVYLTDNTASRVILSQSGSIGSAFMLRYNGFGNSWEFAVSRAESYAPTYDSSYSAAGAPALNTWTHLTGVYDSGTASVTLYVNGVAQTPASHTSVWNATGPLEVGRVREFGAWQTGSVSGWGPWIGKVDDVRTYARALSSADATILYNGGVGGAGSLGSVSLGQPGALQGTISGQQASTSAGYSGSNAYNPTVYSNPTTYSIECWFQSATAGGTLIDFANVAWHNSGVIANRLHVGSTGKLDFGTTSSNSNYIQSPGVYNDGLWHYVAVTVSPATGMAMYVDGSLVASLNYSAESNFSGYWRWGGDTHNSAWSTPDYFSGRIDEIAVYSTVLTAQQIAIHYAANR